MLNSSIYVHRDAFAIVSSAPSFRLFFASYFLRIPGNEWGLEGKEEGGKSLTLTS